MKKLYLGAALALACLFSSPAAALTLCTGAADQPYAQAGDMIKDEAKSAGIDVEVVKETGGTWGNIQLSLQGKCDAFIGQPDGLAYLKRTEPGNAGKFVPIADLHREVLGAVCSKKSGVTDIGELENDPKKYSIALGERGSGAWLIWQNFISEDPDYAPVRQTDESSDLGLSAVANNQTTCMLIPAAVVNSTMATADALYGHGITLVGVNDRDFDDAVDPQDELLYTYGEIPGGTYPKSLQAGWFTSKSTLTWLAKVYINKDTLTDKNALKAFTRSVAKARSGIVSNFGE